VKVQIIAGSGGAVIPEPPIEVALVIESSEGEEIIELINDPEPEANPRFGTTTLHFALNLEPGDYEVVALLGIHPDLKPEGHVGFPSFVLGEYVGTFSFTVPESGCIHMGQLSFEYFRVSPGTRSQQEYDLKRVGESLNQPTYYVAYLKTGSLISKDARANRIDKRFWKEEVINRGCDFGHTVWVIQ
jgi:hypothetical protein